MNIDEMLSGARDVMTVQRVYGDPIERDGILIVPAVAVRGGGGGGSDSENNGGGGFGAEAKPAGAWIIRDGAVDWEPAVDATRIAMMGMFTAIFFLWVIRSIAKAQAKVQLKAAGKR